MLVDIANLWVRFPTPHGLSDAVRGVSLTLGQEKLGIVGESGSGKSLTARAILRLLPEQAKITADRLTFDGIDILTANEAICVPSRQARRAHLQDPKFSLNPVMTAGAQIAEAWRAHRGGCAQARAPAAIDLLAQVQLEPARRRPLPAPALRRHGPARDYRMMLAPDPSC